MYIKRLKKDFHILGEKLIAHKGIYGEFNQETVTPNTFLACKLAIDNNIPFECDVRNTLDNIPVLAHDSVILNENGQEICICKYTYEELCAILPKNTICKLEDVLKYNNSKVGVVIDAKEAHIFYPKYRNNLADLLNKYATKGEILLQSFNPFFMLNIRSKLKNVLTAQLICRGKTILNAFKAPKTLAYAYERILSLVCFIARTDVINMENHSDPSWHLRTKYFISRKAYLGVNVKKGRISYKMEHSIYKGARRIKKIPDIIQLKLVKIASDLTKKPVIAFTIKNEREFGKMENLYIVNYISDFSKLGVEGYIAKINELSKLKKNQ